MADLLNGTDIQQTTTADIVYYYPPQFMNNDSRDTALFIIKVIIYPIIGITGLIGNLISGIVLKRTGLHQPSNIFLLALAVADSGCLIWAIDISGILPYVTGDVPGVYTFWEFNPSISLVLFRIYVCVTVISRLSQKISATLTFVIALERLIAVFFPLQFPVIVTRKRAWYVVVSTVLFWLPSGIAVGFFYRFIALIILINGKTKTTGIWGVGESEFYTNNKVVQYLWGKVMVHVSHTIPLVLVTASCVVLFVKITIARQRRRKLTSSSSGQKTSSAQTSITLLLVCSVYSLARFLYLLEYLPIFSFNNVYWMNLALVYYHIRDGFLFINSACNFFIYVMFNPKFRKTLKSVFMRNFNSQK